MESNYQKLWLYTLDGGGPIFTSVYLAVLVLTMRIWIGSLTRAVVKVCLLQSALIVLGSGCIGSAKRCDVNDKCIRNAPISSQLNVCVTNVCRWHIVRCGAARPC